MHIYSWQMCPHQLSIDHCNTTTQNLVSRNTEIALYRPHTVSLFSPFHITYAHRPSLSFYSIDHLNSTTLNLISRNTEIALYRPSTVSLFSPFHITYAHRPSLSFYSIDHWNSTALNLISRNTEIALYRPSTVSLFSLFHITYAQSLSISLSPSIEQRSLEHHYTESRIQKYRDSAVQAYYHFTISHHICT